MYIKLDFDKYKDFVSVYKKNKYDSDYLLIKIKKELSENEKIMPRVRVINQEIDKSLFDYMNSDEVLFAINGGIFNTGTCEAECLLVSNNKIYKDQKETYIHTDIKDGGEKRDELFILGITYNGDLKIYDSSYSAEDIINDGCVDAVMGFVPLIRDYKEVNYDNVCSYISMDKHPRQVIGQLDNGDFIVITVLKPGMKLEEVREILKELNVKNAYNLDGGSSTQTVYYKDSLIPFYRGETGRNIPSIITFEVITGDLVI